MFLPLLEQVFVRRPFPFRRRCRPTFQPRCIQLKAASPRRSRLRYWDLSPPCYRLTHTAGAFTVINRLVSRLYLQEIRSQLYRLKLLQCRATTISLHQLTGTEMMSDGVPSLISLKSARRVKVVMTTLGAPLATPPTKTMRMMTWRMQNGPSSLSF